MKVINFENALKMKELGMSGACEFAYVYKLSSTLGKNCYFEHEINGNTYVFDPGIDMLVADNGVFQLLPTDQAIAATNNEGDAYALAYDCFELTQFSSLINVNYNSDPNVVVDRVIEAYIFEKSQAVKTYMYMDSAIRNLVEFGLALGLPKPAAESFKHAFDDLKLNITIDKENGNVLVTGVNGIPFCDSKHGIRL